MDWLQFFANIISNIAWPIVVGLIAWRLKSPLSSLINHLKSVKLGDKEAEFFERKQNVPEDASDSAKLKELIPADITGLLEKQVEVITQQINLKSSDQDKIDMLVRNIAHLQIVNHFESIYNAIFGSQLRLLEHLLTLNKNTATTNIIVDFFEKAKLDNPDTYKNKNFSEWIDFLLNFKLIENNEDKWTITKEGKGFIRYINTANYDKKLPL